MTNEKTTDSAASALSAGLGGNDNYNERTNK